MSDTLPGSGDCAPLISVIIPLFNKESYVVDSLMSVFSQSYENFEILVVNDGSTDSSLDKVKQFQDHRLAIIDKQNEGVSTARNIGVVRSSGELLAFLDADDFWFKDHLLHVVKALKKFPECGAVSNSFCRKAIKLENNFDVRYSLVRDYINQAALGKKTMWTSSSAMRRSIFEKAGGFPPNESHGEDLALWLQASLQAPVVFTDYIGAFYRETGDGLTSKLVCYPDALTKSIDRILASQKCSAQERKSLERYRTRNALAQVITAYRHGNRQEAVRFLSVAKIYRENFWRYLGLLLLSYLPKKYFTIILNLYISTKKRFNLN
jgi:glycosyltransferase involved in cell wall biosynthesis